MMQVAQEIANGDIKPPSKEKPGDAFNHPPTTGIPGTNTHGTAANNEASPTADAMNRAKEQLAADMQALGDHQQELTAGQGGPSHNQDKNDVLHIIKALGLAFFGIGFLYTGVRTGLAGIRFIDRHLVPGGETRHLLRKGKVNARALARNVEKGQRALPPPQGWAPQPIPAPPHAKASPAAITGGLISSRKPPRTASTVLALPLPRIVPQPDPAMQLEDGHRRIGWNRRFASGAALFLVGAVPAAISYFSSTTAGNATELAHKVAAVSEQICKSCRMMADHGMAALNIASDKAVDFAHQVGAQVAAHSTETIATAVGAGVAAAAFVAAKNMLPRAAR